MAKLKPGETLFRDESVFEPNYLPEDFLFRDSEVKELTACMKPALKGMKPANAFIFGKPATGKTTATKLIFNKLQEETGKAVTVHVNCHIYNSEYRILGELHKKLFGFVPPETGLPVAALYDKVFTKLDREKKALVMALDDMNFYDAKQANAILYDLIRAYEVYPKIKTAIWCISTANMMHKLDDKVRSCFVSNVLEFAPYGKDEMKEILKARAGAGLATNAITDAVLLKIAGSSADLRHAIETLKKSAMLAEDEMATKITEKHAERALKSFEAPVSSMLIDDEKIMLDLLKKKAMESGELYEEYRKITGSSYATFFRIIQKLEKAKLIEKENIEKEKGRTSRIRLAK